MTWQHLNSLGVALQLRDRLSKTVAGQAYRRICIECQQLTLSDLKVQEWEQSRQWLLHHQQDILNTNIRVKEIAEKLNKKVKQIVYARTKLRKMLNIIPPMPGADWVRAHQVDLQKLSITELQNKYHKTQGQIEYSLKVLKILQQMKLNNI